MPVLPTRKGVLFVAIGTMGDVQPVASMATKFSKAECTIATNQRHFRLFAGKPCVDVGFDPRQMFSTSEGQALISSASYDPRRLKAMKRLVADRIETVVSTLRPLFQSHIVVVVSGLPFGVNAFAKECGSRAIRVMLNPAWPNSEFPTFYLNTNRSMGALLNRLSYNAAETIARMMFRRIIAAAETALESRRSILFDSFWENSDTLFALPAAFTSEPIRRSQHAAIVGFIRPVRQSPSSEFSRVLLELERATSPVIYCGFGSMQTARTAALIDSVARACADLGAVVAVQAPESDIPDGPQVVPVPHGDHRDLFPLCSALIHHGGAGTTVASLDSGIPFAIVPQWADQYYWQQRTLELGLSYQSPRRRAQKSGEAWKAVISKMLSEVAGVGHTRRNIAGPDGRSGAVDFIRQALA